MYYEKGIIVFLCGERRGGEGRGVMEVFIVYVLVGGDC